ncbi:hypothetical protein C7H19_15410 [Aphanothece hegewaldii CCALA 016]|uniref:Pentapeptide repeat-containing protein n=1 Tax=Aphanothece hegewaldii CCALA 016 TaxID=2107694 RepID=A0A2T1LVQ0_9CHRO|nr:pentapeptide repeat-containing protein [Aphanothece hegewaldii]PSF35811.1 hypothetical protein C7H19_15410 [Aphanothece hegewaldii CCALA 016]
MEALETQFLLKVKEKRQELNLAPLSHNLPLMDTLDSPKTQVASNYAEGQRNFSRVNLANQDLEGIDLSGACLVGANFFNCNLRGAKLEDCDLRLCNFQKSNLSGASLKRSNCEKARFLGTNLRNANLEQANLQEAVIEAVKCKRTNLKKALLTSINKSGRKRMIKIKYPCFIPLGEYDYEGLLQEYNLQYNRLKKAATIVMLCLLFGFLNFLAFRFQI